MLKKLRLLSIALLIVCVSFLAACGSDSASSNKANPKELITEAMNKSMEMESYAFEGDLIISVDLDESMVTDEDMQMLASLLEELKVGFKGAYQADIEQAEFIFETNLNLGDLKTVLEVPIFIKGEKIWVKIPAIPGMIPDEFAGQQVELDLKQLAEMSGEEYISIFETANSDNPELALVQNIIDIFMSNLDDSLFALSSEEGESVVTVDFSGDKFNTVLETMFTSTLPEVVELLEQEQYAELLGLTAGDLADLKELKNALPEELEEILQEVKSILKVNKGEFAFHLNKDKFVTKQVMDFDLTFSDPDSAQEFTLTISSTQHTSKINEEQEFTLEVPTDNIFDLSAMLGMFMPSGMDGTFPGLEAEGFEDNEEWNMEMDPMDELFYALFEEEWFNAPEIQELLFTDLNFQEALYDEAVLQQLLDDPAYRTSFFAEYGIEVK